MSKGYINITIQSLEASVKDIPKQPMSLSIKFGQAVAKSEPGKWTNSYLLKIPDDVPRLALQLTYWGIKPKKENKEEQKKKETQEKTTSTQSKTQQEEDVVFSECRFDVSPFFQFEGKTHIFQSNMNNEDGEKTAHLKIKLTYYSASNGKLKIKILNLLLTESISEKYKNLTVRFKLGPFIKTSPLMKDSNSWAEPLQLVILNPTLNLTVQLLSEGNQIGEYVVYNIQKQGYLTKQPKAIQNGLYWNDKSSGKIKYQVQNIP